MEVNGRETRTVGTVTHNLPAVSSVGSMGLSDFHPFGLHKKQQTGRQTRT